MFKELKGSYLLACSGGPDSMALFDMLIKEKISFKVAHVNYHHRDSAKRDELIVKNYAEKYNIDFFLKDFEEGSGNFQDQARVFRYNFFRDIVKDEKLDGVLVAHNLDDLIETYILQKKRGSMPSVYGLASINDLNGLKVYRPLLNISKKDLEKYCVKENVPYGIDESNLKDDYSRNKIRHNIVSKMSEDEINNTLIEINSLNKEIQKRKDSVQKYLEYEYLDVDEYRRIKDFDMYLRLKIDMSLSKDYILEIHNQLLNSSSVKIEYKELIILKEYQKISVFTRSSDYEYILNKDEFTDTPYFIFKKEGSNFEAVNLSDKDYPITVRNFKPGDFIRMRYGNKKVSRYFIDSKIPLKERMKWPVIVNSKGVVIHVCGMGSDVDHFAKEPTFFMVKL